MSATVERRHPAAELARVLAAREGKAVTGSAWATVWV